jgi:hypothetical protein
MNGAGIMQAAGSAITSEFTGPFGGSRRANFRGGAPPTLPRHDFEIPADDVKIACSLYREL